MSQALWEQRFLSSTRGQIVTLLRRGGRTVEELRRALHLSENAVRAQLTNLERDGLVELAGKRRVGRKPSSVYALTAAADRLFPASYASLLGLVLDALSDQVPQPVLEAICRDAGRRLAAKVAPARPPPAVLATRVERARSVLHDLGGLVVLDRPDDQHDVFVLRGYRCPWALVTRDHPAVCQLAETLLSEVIAAPVRARCEPGDPPTCTFLVASPGEGTLPAPSVQPDRG